MGSFKIIYSMLRESTKTNFGLLWSLNFVHQIFGRDRHNSHKNIVDSYESGHVKYYKCFKTCTRSVSEKYTEMGTCPAIKEPHCHLSVKLLKRAKRAISLVLLIDVTFVQTFNSKLKKSVQQVMHVIFIHSNCKFHSRRCLSTLNIMEMLKFHSIHINLSAVRARTLTASSQIADFPYFNKPHVH